MPFTFSHPAIVLPLTCLPKKCYSLTGLVIGSLTPDFEYFLRMRILSNYSHTTGGLFWFDLPLGLLLAFIFHNIVRDSLLDNLPTFFRLRFSALRQCNWNRYFQKNWFVVIVSILVGAASHIFWDSFTHRNAYFVQLIPALNNTIDLFGRTVAIFKILQHGSTLIGGLIVIFAIYKLPKNTIQKENIQNIHGKYWLILIGLTLAVVAARLWGGLELRQYGNLIVTGISAGLLSLILTPILLKIALKTPISR